MQQNLFSKMKCINIKSFGGSEQLEVQERDIPKPKENEVLLKIEGFGINRADVLQRKGGYQPPKGATDVLGLEAYGILPENPDQKYCALLSGGGYAEYVNVPKDHLIPFPSNLDPKHGPGLAEVWLTAYLILRKIGQFSQNQRVLIYAGASGVGTSAIQLAKLFGGENAQIFYTVSSQDKIDFCQKLGATKGYNYKELSQEQIVADIMEMTDKKGVDVVLDCVGGQNYKLTSDSVGLDGKWISYGLLGGPKIPDFNLAPFLRKRVQLIGSTLRSRDNQYKTDLIQDFNKEVVPALKNNELQLLTDKIFQLNWEENSAIPVKEAHDFMESNQNIGKILVKCQK